VPPPPPPWFEEIGRQSNDYSNASRFARKGSAAETVGRPHSWARAHRDVLHATRGSSRPAARGLQRVGVVDPNELGTGARIRPERRVERTSKPPPRNDDDAVSSRSWIPSTCRTAEECAATSRALFATLFKRMTWLLVVASGCGFLARHASNRARTAKFARRIKDKGVESQSAQRSRSRPQYRSREYNQGRALEARVSPIRHDTAGVQREQL